jgi:hypothetical protein
MIYDDMIVTLEPWELFAAAEAAGRQHCDVLLKPGAQDRGGNEDRDAIDRKMAGACAEVAVSRWTGRRWIGPAGRGAPDVFGLEVRVRRGNPRDESLELLMYDYDDENHKDTPFVLVVGEKLVWRIVGWITPREARALLYSDMPDEQKGVRMHDFGRRGKPVMCIAQSRLKPIDEFKVAA